MKPVAKLLTPVGAHGPAGTVDGIAFGYRNPRHLLGPVPAGAGIRPAHIRLLPAGVGADDAQAAAGGELLVGDARGDDDHVTRIEGHGDTVLAAQPGHHRTAVDSEHLVGRAVVVMKGEYAVTPASDPTVGDEALLEHGGRIMPVERYGSPIDEQRQAGVVGDLCVGLEQVRDDRWIFGTGTDAVAIRCHGLCLRGVAWTLARP